MSRELTERRTTQNACFVRSPWTCRTRTSSLASVACRWVGFLRVTAGAYRYKICQFCYNRLLTSDARCPGCRRPYDAKAVVYQPVDFEELA